MSKPEPKEFYDGQQLVRYYEEVKGITPWKLNLRDCFDLEQAGQNVIISCEQYPEDDLSDFRRWLLQEFGEFIYVKIWW